MAIDAPSPDLAATVDFLWSVPAAHGGAPFHELLPDAGVHLAFRLSPAGGRVVLLGPATRRAALALAPGVAVVGLRFQPGCAPRLADAAAAELVDGWAEVARLGGRPADAVCDELAAAPGAAERRRVLEALLRRPAPPLVDDPRCRRAAALLTARGGAARVEELAGALGLGARTLERALARGMGIAPKQLARLVRLRRVLGELRAGACAGLAELALRCGYADQAHLTRDFRDLTGRPPGAPGAHQAQPLLGPDAPVVHGPGR